MLEYGYVIELNFPELKIKIDNPIVFTVIKTPINKLSSFIYMFVDLPSDVYNVILDEFNKLKKQHYYLNCYLSIYTKPNIYSCNMLKTYKNLKEDVIIKDKILSIVSIKSITNSSVKGGVRNTLVQFFISNPTTLILKNQYSLSKTFYNTTVKNVVDQFKSILKKYNVDVYDKLEYNTHVYDLIHIDQDVSVLEALYFLQKYYKVTNDIPCFFYDIFSSNAIFNQIDTYKMYSYNQYEKLKKVDLSKSADACFEIIRDENFNIEKFSKFTIDPSTIVFVKNDGDTIVKKVNDKISINDSKDKEGKYKKLFKDVSNNFVLNLYAPDTPDNSLKRYYLTKKFISLIYKISRIEIRNTDFRIFDIGVIYKHSKESKYNMVFHSLSYQFVREKITDNIMRCDVIGDAFLLNV